MTRAERFALVTGIIGLVADLLALGTLAASFVHPSSRQVPIPTQSPLAVRMVRLLPPAYCLLIVCWFLVRRSYIRFLDSHQFAPTTLDAVDALRKWYRGEFFGYVYRTVSAVCLVCLPLAFLLTKSWAPVNNGNEFLKRVALTVGVELAVGCFAILVIYLAMPVVYTDYNFFGGDYYQ